ncbi:Cupin domain protein [Vibrio thalassae]|uniref:Cupin domain protein n=1 Tax=Vibrio thalassae TaxID=1243014 RepID=A0A240EG41_9VIBR|nr:cupin domain-containing protein [Vibrio thalassae]SNX47644.1 Cupin domain protein [Vibrio thalassae]
MTLRYRSSIAYSPTTHRVDLIEYIIVLEGDVEILFEGKWHAVAQGESLRFYSDQPHGYKAVTERAVFQNIVCYPS